MSSCPECSAQVADSETFLRTLLDAPRAGSDRILAFYDSRANAICKDPRLLLIPLDDHMCHRGDGLFESICYRQRLVFALDAHMLRLADGATALGIKPPIPFERIRELIIEVARAGGADHGDLRVFLTRGPGGFGISPSECPLAGLYIVAMAAPLPNPEVYRKGLTAFGSSYPPKQEFLARIKNTNYLPNVFMAVEAASRGRDFAITFDENGHMGEAAIANVAIVDEEGKLRSPEIRRILPGTTLLAALEIASESMPVVHGPIHKKEIFSAREMMLFTSATLCVPVTHFDDHPIGHGKEAGKPGPVSAWLRDRLLDFMLATGTPF